MKPVLFTLLAIMAFVYVSLCFRATIWDMQPTVTQPLKLAQPAPPAPIAKPAATEKPKLTDAEIDLIVRVKALQQEMKDFDVHSVSLHQAQAKQSEFQRRSESLMLEMSLRSK